MIISCEACSWRHVHFKWRYMYMYMYVYLFSKTMRYEIDAWNTCTFCFLIKKCLFDEKTKGFIYFLSIFNGYLWVLLQQAKQMCSLPISIKDKHRKADKKIEESITCKYMYFASNKTLKFYDREACELLVKLPTSISLVHITFLILSPIIKKTKTFPLNCQVKSKELLFPESHGS